MQRKSVIALCAALALICVLETSGEARWRGSIGGMSVGPFGPRGTDPSPPFFYSDPPWSVLDLGPIHAPHHGVSIMLPPPVSIPAASESTPSTAPSVPPVP